MATKKTAIRKAAAKSESQRKATGIKKAGSGKAASRSAFKKSTAKAGAAKKATPPKGTSKRAATKKVTGVRSATEAAARKATSEPPAGKKSARAKSSNQPAPQGEKVEGAFRMAPQLTFPVVGIGASAGGMQAFEEFFRHLPANPGMAVVLISHLDPDHTSILHELLQKSTTMPVHQVTDGVAIEPNQVYVGPPGKNVAILNGTLQLMKPIETHGRRLPIDYWFRSLAQDQKEKAIGIILSGNGSDGTLGIKAIKGESGMVMAQDPESAKFTGMPCSAIATGLVDFVLPAGKMPERLMGYTRGPYLKEPALDFGVTTSVLAGMQKIFVLLRARTGHDFSFYKVSTLRRRIARRMNIHQITGHKQYIRYLEENPQEVDLMFKELLIGVTNFFRDREAFDVLAAKVLPELIEAKADNGPLRVWVPGCSTGEEAYSVAILLRETMDRLRKHLDVQIFATDLDSQAIEAARMGLYPDGISVDVSLKRLKRFFGRENDHYRIKKEIRETVIFAEQNLIKDPPFTKLDMLSCRNLLIYLQADLQKRLLPLFHYAIRPGGLLFLGPSETTGGFSDLFEVVDKKWKVFRRKEGVAAYTAAEFPLHRPQEDPGEIPVPIPAARDTHANVAQLSARLLSERYAPPSVIVNEHGDLIYIHGSTGLYLQPAPGQPTHNILTMAREGLRYEMAAALRKAARQGGEIIRRDIQVKTYGGFVRIDLAAVKIADPEALRGLIMVTFNAASEIIPAPPAEKTKRGTPRKRTERQSALERQLQVTKESLQSTIEELETSNEELESTNEELQSTNEEMQSSNEELETSKEEMQSLNEELQTVNSELQGKIEELSQANDDMANLLNATDIATIFLDNDLCIRRFTVQATEVIRLIPSDVGRPISDIVSQLNYDTLEQDAGQVLKTLSFREIEVKAEDGTWYLTRIMPYRTAENAIDGLVITFVDIHRLKKAKEELACANAALQRDIAERIRVEAKLRRLATVVMDSNDAVTVQDLEGNITGWNRAAERMYGWSESEALAMNIHDLVPNDLKDDALAVVRALADGERIESFETQRVTKEGQILDAWLTVTQLVDEAGKVTAVATTERDITERRAAAEALERLNRELARKNKELESVLYIASHDLWSPLVNIKGFSSELDQACKTVPSLVADAQLPSDLKKQLSTILEDVVPTALEFIVASVAKMDTLLDGLLRLSRLGQAALQFEQLDMNAMLSEIAKSFEFRIRDTGATLQIDTLPPCFGDTTQINQVFSNLLDNALKYLDPTRSGVIRIHGQQKEGRAVYCVEDNGIGIAPEHDNKIFEAFRRLDPEGSVAGEGLGLATVRRILDRHDGKIWLESEPGKGTRFFVSLATRAGVSATYPMASLAVPATV